MSEKGRPIWFPFREVGICLSIAEAACAATSERTTSSPISGNGESAGSTCSSSLIPTRTIMAGGPSAWGEKPSEKREETRVVFLPHHGSPRAQPEAWIRAASPDVVVSQNSDCFRKWNLVPCVQSFFLDNGAFTIRSDGESMFIEQEKRTRIWKIMLRLSPEG